MTGRTKSAITTLTITTERAGCDMNKNIYLFWTGDNPLTENRTIAIASIKKCISTCNIILINKNNLNEYILDDYPLHPGYQYLSCNHKSDYLRSYFMNFYGGGYLDIKHVTMDNNWYECFCKIERNKHIEIIGAKEEDSFDFTDDKILLTNIGFICRAHSEFTEKWYKRVQIKMDERYNDLKKYPAIDVFGQNGNY